MDYPTLIHCSKVTLLSILDGSMNKLFYVFAAMMIGFLSANVVAIGCFPQANWMMQANLAQNP